MDSTPMSGGISLCPVAGWGFLGCVAAGILAATGAVLADVDSVVVFNEVHYHPADPEEALEYVELFNQNSVDVDLSGWSLEGAGTYVFPNGAMIAGRGYLVLARNPQALQEATGYSGAMGPLPGRLSNGGERLVLRNHNQRSMDILEYGDGELWPAGADGCGASLAKVYPWKVSGPEINWRASEDLGGSPGEPNRWSDGSFQLLSEVDPAGDDILRVELFHSGNTPVVLEGLRLELTSGAALDLSGPPLVEGTYRVFEVDTSELASEAGDRLFLANPATNRLLDAVVLAESPRARSWPGAGERWLFADSTSFGEPNQVELEDAVVINEIMYHHRPRYRDPNGSETYAEDPEEWVELFNRSNQNIDLSGWSFAGGIGYVFPAGTVLEAGSYLVVTAGREAFLARHGEVMAVGDFERSLGNGGDFIELRDAKGNPADSVRYADGAPWPDYADGGGSSLELRNPEMDNSVPEAWADSREDLQSEWEEFSFRGVARQPVYTATVRQFHELRMGLLEAGECLVDDIAVVADPGGTAASTSLVKNGSFLGSIFTPFTAVHWRFLGNHDQTEVKTDEGQPGGLMHLRAGSQFNYLNNLVETTLREEVVNGRTYEIRFRAKWLRGSPMLRSEIYYNKLAWVARLPQPGKHGTPGRRNSTFEDNPGPTFSGVIQDPVLPAASEPVRIRAQI
ncbi:MAG TPA: lamin tail domain-containing protein, partial [Verrucomicrobiales bacterium]|nr:lamin tail domain-containing protein [Verrucomicrobiales bacterium]